MIYITKGDDTVLHVNMTVNGQPYIMQDGDTITLAVERFVKGGDPIRVLTDTSATADIEIGHDLTEGLTPGYYDAEVQLTTWDGTIYTVYPPTRELTDRQCLGLEAWNNLLVRREVVVPDAAE